MTQNAEQENGGTLDFHVSEQVLNRPSVVSVFEQVSRKGIPQRVQRRVLRDSRIPHCRCSFLLHSRNVDMMCALFADESFRR